MNEQEQYWKNNDEYHQRNRVDWKARIPFWERMLALTHAQTVLEVGCGPGWNLRALRAIQAGPFLRGIDINQSAVDEARRNGLDVALLHAGDARQNYREMFDLVFTGGMLIHIAPEEIKQTMESIAATTTKHVLAIEYEAEEEQEIEYRGQKGLLWKRPYGKLYADIGLKELASGPAGEGFDRCTYWLMEKP